MELDGLIGQSRAVKRVLRQVGTVGPTDATVLLLGETGTGKEMLARALHRLSARRNDGFVRINCAAIPSSIVENELFGHERGAFTGAVNCQTGRVEAANKGTLFLDEVGDLAPDVQPKLLRVLQEQEFERLGSTRVIRVDVRVIGATNHDLAEMVARRQFRTDLYYRLNVFPIRVPPLRERREDIPLLVRHFVRQYAARLGRHVEHVPDLAMRALQRWDWPGNIRELQNVIERAVILSPGRNLNVPIEDLGRRWGPRTAAAPSERLIDIERAAIKKALHDTGGVVGGPDGAASRLGLKRTTLQSRMRGLGIKRPTF